MRTTNELNKKNVGTRLRPCPNNKGITLIALVITIIVMLILVGVTITMAVNGGLFTQAGKATSDTQNAIDAEQQLASGEINVGGVWYDSIDDYLAGIPSTGVKIKLSIKGTRVTTVPVPEGFEYKEGTIDTGYVIVNKTDGNEFVWIPVDTNQKISLNLESEMDIKELKLYDPCGEVKLTVADEDIGTTYSNTEIIPTVNGMYMVVATTEEGITQKTLTVKSLYALDTSNDWWSSDEYAKTLGYDNFEAWALNYIKEEYGLDSIDAALQAMGYPTLETALSAINGPDYTKYQDMEDYSAEVEKNGGFYIARYEAGTNPENPRKSGNSEAEVSTIITANGTPVSKEGYAPYNYVTHSQAQGLAESMYNSEEYTDTLITCAAWDRTLGWIYETKGKNTKEIVGDSTSWGNYYNAEFEITKGKYSENGGNSYTSFTGTYKKPAEKRVLLTTGATTRNAVNNIFDLAGNVEEWTLTSYEKEGSSYRVQRGGSCNNYGNYSPAFGYSHYSTTYCDNYIGFRPALYLN